jgi:hypothetical protein
LPDSGAEAWVKRPNLLQSRGFLGDPGLIVAAA